MFINLVNNQIKFYINTMFTFRCKNRRTNKFDSFDNRHQHHNNKRFFNGSRFTVFILIYVYIASTISNSIATPTTTLTRENNRNKNETMRSHSPSSHLQKNFNAIELSWKFSKIFESTTSSASNLTLSNNNIRNENHSKPEDMVNFIGMCDCSTRKVIKRRLENCAKICRMKKPRNHQIAAIKIKTKGIHSIWNIINAHQSDTSKEDKRHLNISIPVTQVAGNSNKKLNQNVIKNKLNKFDKNNNKNKEEFNSIAIDSKHKYIDNVKNAMYYVNANTNSAPTENSNQNVLNSMATKLQKMDFNYKRNANRRKRSKTLTKLQANQFQMINTTELQLLLGQTSFSPTTKHSNNTNVNLNGFIDTSKLDEGGVEKNTDIITSNVNRTMNTTSKFQEHCIQHRTHFFVSYIVFVVVSFNSCSYLFVFLLLKCLKGNYVSNLNTRQSKVGKLNIISILWNSKKKHIRP